MQSKHIIAIKENVYSNILKATANSIEIDKDLGDRIAQFVRIHPYNLMPGSNDYVTRNQEINDNLKKLGILTMFYSIHNDSYFCFVEKIEDFDEIFIMLKVD